MQSKATPGGLTRRQDAVEVSVFLLLILPSLALSYAGSGVKNVSFPLVAGATIMRDLGLLGLILLLLSRDRQPFTMVGWVPRRAWLEAGLGFLLSIPLIAGTRLLEAALQAAGLSGPTPSSSELPAGAGEALLGLVLVAVVAVTEETIFRGYLVLRLATVLRGRVQAVLVSTVIFAFGHGYEGGAAVVTVGLTGLVFALVYVWRKSLIAPIVMHFMLDFVAIVLGPLLSP